MPPKTISRLQDIQATKVAAKIAAKIAGILRKEESAVKTTKDPIKTPGHPTKLAAKNAAKTKGTC